MNSIKTLRFWAKLEDFEQNIMTVLKLEDYD